MSNLSEWPETPTPFTFEGKPHHIGVRRIGGQFRIRIWDQDSNLSGQGVENRAAEFWMWPDVATSTDAIRLLGAVKGSMGDPREASAARAAVHVLSGPLPGAQPA